MGINAFFTYTIILGKGVPWPAALGIIFWAGVFFLLISVTPIRESIAKDKPYDQFVREILAATGDENQAPPTVWYKELQNPEQFVDDTIRILTACPQVRDIGDGEHRQTGRRIASLNGRFERIGVRRWSDTDYLSVRDVRQQGRGFTREQCGWMRCANNEFDSHSVKGPSAA